MRARFGVAMMGLALGACAPPAPDEVASVELGAKIKLLASEVGYTPSGGLTSTDVQGALDELAARPNLPGPQGPQGPQGPAGPAGSGIASLESLNGVACDGHFGGGIMGVLVAHVEDFNGDIGAYQARDVTLTCAYPAAVSQAYPASLDFGEIISSPVEYLAVTITNIGGLPLALDMGLTQISDPNGATVFAIASTNCGTTLAPQESCFVTVSATRPATFPGLYFEYTGELRWSSTALGTVAVPLRAYVYIIG